MTIIRFNEIVEQIIKSYLQNYKFDLFFYSLEGAINAIEEVDLSLLKFLRDLINRLETNKYLLEDEKLIEQTINIIQELQIKLKEYVRN